MHNQHHDFDFAQSNSWHRNIQAVLALLAAAVVAIAVVAFALTTATSGADDDTTSHLKFYEYQNGLGAGGYDVVSYFAQAKALEGSPNYVAEWGGETWHFTSPENRDKFLAEPLRYIPQYGGHCAYAVAKGYLVQSSPKAWSIKDGKLYLNYNLPTRTVWLASANKFIQKSEKAWPKLSAPKPKAKVSTDS